MNTEKINEFLSGLGSTPDQVAQTLELQGIKGDFTPDMCPLSIAINRAQGPGTRTMVFPEFGGSGWVYVSDKGAESVNDRLSLVLTEFARKFDQMEYPSLTTQDRLDEQRAKAESWKSLISSTS